MHREANRLLGKKTKNRIALARAASRPATLHTRAAWGAQPDEPLPDFPRALRRTLRELGVTEEIADKMIGSGASTPSGKGCKKGKGKGKE